jgi:hypothetical protein
MTTVAFLTLFFGLISGPYPVELAVDGPVAAVEVQVDGHVAGRIAEPPWKATLDFGPALLPHQIVARALDAQGHEIARTEEWANLPHPLTKAEIVLEQDGNQPPKAATVVWKNLAGEEVRSVALTFDGKPVKLDRDRRGALPKHDLKSLHTLSALVTFKSYRTVRKELTYGGEYGSEVSTELTGIPVRVKSGQAPSAGQLAGWLTEQSQPLSVNAVEEGPAQLFIVRGFFESDFTPRAAKLRNLTGQILGDTDQYLMVSTAAQRIAGSDESSDLFLITAPAAYGRGGDVFRAIRKWRVPEPAPGSIRIADAVATAGLAAMRENRRRAVLLLLAGDPEDVSLYDPATVRNFLAALRVPLYVWYLGTPKPGSTAAAWNAEEIVQTWHASAAAERVRKELDSQRIVMVDGRHLPQSVALSPTAAASGLELVGTAP